MKILYRDAKSIVFWNNLIAPWGTHSLKFFGATGQVALLFFESIVGICTKPIKWRHVLDQMNKVGVTSFPLVFLTALFTGMVLALQSAYQLKLFAATQYTADLVALSVTRELGPVLTAMVVAGRVGASITAELGTMKVTEQIDALSSLAVDPVRYLVVPRFIAAFFMLPFLTLYADFIGMFGGFLIGTTTLGLSATQYFQSTFFRALVLKDVMTGLIKSFAFGIIISIVGCWQGFNAEGGAEGVGKATTISVVTSLVLIISSDCLFTALFYFVFG
ncbi:MAG: ABC transporter permease [Candidatus Omnitrophica bacterium]|nr:ABC transporter permease [Candidatus Omnitrophota bacterium]